MADYSGYPTKEMKAWLAKRKALNKLMEQENERLKLENEKLRRANNAFRMEHFKQTCSICGTSAGIFCLGTEIEHQHVDATRQETEAEQPEVVELPFFPTAVSQEDAPLKQDVPAPSNQDEPAPYNQDEPAPSK